MTKGVSRLAVATSYRLQQHDLLKPRDLPSLNLILCEGRLPGATLNGRSRPGEVVYVCARELTQGRSRAGRYARKG